MGIFDSLSFLIFPFLYVYMCYRCRKFRLRCEELEKENEDLKRKIEWDM